MTANAAIRIGTSGFSYKEWLGGFYPEKLAGPKMLAHYAGKLPTVEINYTFRAMPRREMLEKWAMQTPETFRFALKAPQRITHFAKLKGTDDIVAHFAEVASAMGAHLGPSLFQLPPSLKRDDAFGHSNDPGIRREPLCQAAALRSSAIVAPTDTTAVNNANEGASVGEKRDRP